MWAFYAAFAGILWGIGNILDKYIMTKKITGFIMFIVMAQLINFFFGTFLLFNSNIDGLINHLPQMAIVALLDVVALSTYIFALRMDGASKVIPLFAMALIFIPLGDALFLGNVLTFDKYIGIALIMCFGFLLLLDPNKGLTHSIKVFVVMFFSSLGYSSIWLLGETVVDEVGPIAFTGFMYFLRFLWIPIIAICVFLYGRQSFSKMYQSIKPSFKAGTLIPLIFSNGSGVFGIFLFVKALEGAGIPSMVDAMSMSQYILVFLTPLILTKLWPRYFNEHIPKKILLQKLVCITAMISGGLLILF